MTARLSIETPESVRFTYELADVGARALALGTDLLVQYVTLGLVYIGIMAAAPSAREWRGTVWILMVFAINWLYFACFELAWRGQTPGKRWVGIRVVRSGGYPVTWIAVLIRNLVRVIDSLPGPYGVGLAVAFWEREHRRLGDLVAGTVVVRERAGPPSWQKVRVSPVVVQSAWSDEILGLALDEATRDLVRDYLSRRHEIEGGPRLRVRAEILETVLDHARNSAQRSDLVSRLRADQQDDFLEAIANGEPPLSDSATAWTHVAS